MTFQVLEGPDFGDHRNLLNMMLVTNTPVLKGPDTGDIGSLLNMLLVGNKHLVYSS